MRISNSKTYRHLFFDLDHTLWDFERNSAEALTEMFTTFRLSELGEGVILEDFLALFSRVNGQLWLQYDKGEIDQHTLRYSRFPLILGQLGVKPEDVPNETLAETYLDLTPRKPYLVPHTIEVLEYLRPKYQLHIITNGFPEIQSVKMASGGITDYFDLIVTSENSGSKKPTRGIFDFAVTTLSANRQECLMIGDNLHTDIGGARNAEIDHVFYNPHCIEHQELVTFEIACLRDLKEIL